MNDRNTGDKVREGDEESRLEMGTDIGGIDDSGSGISADIGSKTEMERQQMDKGDRNFAVRQEVDDKIEESMEVPEVPDVFGLDCGFAVQSHDKEEALELLKQHAKASHNVTITDEDVKKMADT